MSRLLGALYMSSFPICLTDESAGALPWSTEAAALPAAGKITGDYYTVNYLNPATGGEGGKHAPYGGWVKKAPLSLVAGELGVGVSVARPLGTDFEYRDMTVEIRRATQMGLNFFQHCLNSGPAGDASNVRRQMTMQRAAGATPGWSNMLMPDMGSATPSWSNITSAAAAQYLLDLYNAGPTGVLTTPDGRMIIAPFLGTTPAAVDTAANGATVPSGTTVGFRRTFWQDVLKRLDDAGVPSVVVPVPNNLTDITRQTFVGLTYTNTAGTTKPAVYGFSVFGARNPGNNGAVTSAASLMRSWDSTLVWLHPASPGDQRPRDQNFNESLGGQQIIDSTTQAFTSATGSNDMIVFYTWNDYAEGSQICLTRSEPVSSYAALGVTRIGGSWKAGLSAVSAPTVDTMHVLQRKHLAAPIVQVRTLIPSGTAITSLPVLALSTSTAAALVVGARLWTTLGQLLVVAAQPAAGATTLTTQSWTPSVSYGPNTAITLETWSYRSAGGTYKPMVNLRWTAGGSGNTTLTSDFAYVVTDLTAPADITVKQGGSTILTYSAPAGLSQQQVGAAVGGPLTVSAARSGTPIFASDLVSPVSTLATPYTQDMAYYTALVANPPVTVPVVSGLPAPVRIFLAQDTAAALAAANPILGPNEPVRESDTGRIKIGDNATPWLSLPYLDQIVLARAVKRVIGLKPGDWQHVTHVTGNATSSVVDPGTLYLVPFDVSADTQLQRLGLFVNTAQTLGSGATITNLLGAYGCDDYGRPKLAGGPLAQGTVVADTALALRSTAVLSFTAAAPRLWLAFLQVSTGTGTTFPAFSTINSCLPLPTATQPGGTVQKYYYATGLSALPTTEIALLAGANTKCPMLQAQAA